MKVTVTARLRNGVLWDLIQRAGSQAELARTLDMSPQVICAWTNFRQIPKNLDTPRLLEMEKKLAQQYGVLLEDLFPVELREQRENLQIRAVTQISVTREVSISALASSQHPMLTEGEAFADFHQQLDNEHLKAQVERALKKLTPREEKIIKMRFGLDDDNEATLGEVADRFAVTTSRVRQIENKAMAKLRHPSRSRHLKKFLPKEGPRKSQAETEEGHDERLRAAEARHNLCEAQKVAVAKHVRHAVSLPPTVGRDYHPIKNAQLRHDLYENPFPVIVRAFADPRCVYRRWKNNVAAIHQRKAWCLGRDDIRRGEMFPLLVRQETPPSL